MNNLKKLALTVLLAVSVPALACNKVPTQGWNIQVQYFCMNGILYATNYDGFTPIIKANGSWYHCR